jgi:ubiquinone/menaquinone biosynthesis C-methylase UbiE
VIARRLVVCALGVLLAASAVAQVHHQHRGASDHRFDNAESWARVFDDPARDAWQKPDEVVRALKRAPGATVADIGAGTGYFAVRLARAVPQGRVYAVDASADMVKYLAGRAQREGLANLAPVQAGARSANLPAPVDLALLVDVYHHVDDRVDYFRGLRASRAPGGRVAIIDFRPETRRGPRHKLPAATVLEEMQRAGYAVTERHEFLPDQYFIVFAPAP